MAQRVFICRNEDEANGFLAGVGWVNEPNIIFGGARLLLNGRVELQFDDRDYEEEAHEKIVEWTITDQEPKTDWGAASEALTDLVETVETTGGLVRRWVGGIGFLYPAADPTWGDMADVYLLACKALGKEPMINE